jgi:hypothetical protein
MTCAVLNSAGAGFLVPGTALNSAGAAFVWCTTVIQYLNTGGGADPNSRERHKTQAQEEDETLLMGFVKDYLNKYL